MPKIRESDILEKYRAFASLDSTGLEEETPIVVNSSSNLPVEKQYLGELKKQTADPYFKHKHYEPFDYEFRDPWEEEQESLSRFLPKKGFSWSEPNDTRNYGKCWKFAYWNGNPLCIIGPDCKRGVLTFQDHFL